MNNKKYYPFRRNNYFYGKLLTVRDFEEEQRYFNDKRRLNNFLISGAGVVSGLDVLCLDEKTISLEAGVALDYLGREIVVEESLIKKLNVLDGFETIQNSGKVYLCLEYKENYEEQIPSVTGGADSDDFYNRIKEGYHLFLTDTIEDEHLLTQDYLFEDKQTIYCDENIKITQTVPKSVSAGERIAIEIIIEKKNLPKIIEVDYTVLLSCFKSEDGKNNIRVYYKDTDIDENKISKFVFYVFADDLKEAIGTMEIEGNGRLTVGSTPKIMEKKVVFKTDITEKSFALSAIQRYMHMHLDDVVTIGSENCIYLCAMNIIKKGQEYSIEYFEPMPFSQYVLSNTMLQTLIKHELKLIKSVRRQKDIKISENGHINYKIEDMSDYISCGEEIIEVDLFSKNKSYFSEEIAHGLGSGDVMVYAAIVEDVEEYSLFNVKKNIFGDMSVFEGTDYELEIAPVKIGIITYPNRGTFRIGLKFLDDAKVPAVKVNWWTVKSKKGSEADLAEVGEVSIQIYPNTITITPREKFKFEALISGTDSRECRWSIRDKDGGSIDVTGIYNAPSKEGVYEIVAELVKYPNIKASVFVIVKDR